VIEKNVEVSDSDLRMVHSERCSVIRKCMNSVNKTKESTVTCFSNCIKKCDADVTQTDYMLTPCNHLFHASCLKGWIELRSNCPQCRRTLHIEN